MKRSDLVLINVRLNLGPELVQQDLLATPFPLNGNEAHNAADCQNVRPARTAPL